MIKILNVLVIFGFILIVISLTKKYTINNYCYNKNINNIKNNENNIINNNNNTNNVSELINTLFNEKSIWLNSIGS